MDKKTILVIDDTPSNLAMLSSVLRENYTVKVANSGSKGIRLALADQAPDLILLDALMPELNGFEVCEVLQTNRKTHAIPVVFLSTLYRDTDVQRGLNLGAVDFISKPVSAAQLRRTIADHLHHEALDTVAA